jgi:transcriptional regulator with XRE-family HTH domain
MSPLFPIFGEFMPDNKGLIGKRIQKIRKIKGLTQEKIAEHAGVSPKYISSIERGKANPTLDLLIILAEIMHVTVADFFDIADEIIGKKELRHLLNALTRNANEQTLRSTIRILRSFFATESK